MSSDTPIEDYIPEPGSTDFKQLNIEITRILNKTISELLSKTLIAADNKLFALTKSSEQAENHDHYFNNMRMLRAERSNIGRRFAQSLSAHMKASRNADIDSASDHIHKLVPEKRKQAIALLHDKAAKLYETSITKLEGQLLELSSQTNSSIHPKAIIPNNFCDAYLASISELELDEDIDDILFELFDTDFVSRLDLLYDAVSKLLEQNGIHNTLKQQPEELEITDEPENPNNQNTINEPETNSEELVIIDKSQDLDNPDNIIQPETQSDEPEIIDEPQELNHPDIDIQSETNSDELEIIDEHQELNHPGINIQSETNSDELEIIDEPDGLDNPDIIDNSKTNIKKTDDQEDVSKIINDFIHGDDEDNKRQSRSAPASKQFYGRDDIIQALTNLQQTYQPLYVAGEKTRVTTDDFKMSLLNSMAKLRPGTSMRSVAAIDAKTIDFVEMVFDAFMDDSNISSVIKNLLLRMQIPIIKLAMLDSKLFQNRKHPGRNVLDKIAHIGIGIDSTDNTLFQTLELIVQQLLYGYDKNIISFQTALTSLNRLHVNETENQNVKEKLTQKKILQEHGRQIVLIELQYHVKNNYIPQQIQPLILKYWATLMLYRYLQHGNESEEWNEAITLLKLLVNSLQPINDQNQWFYLNNSYQELSQRIEELLFETKQDQSKLTESIEHLVKIFTEMLEQSEFKPDEPDFDESAFDTITLEQLTNQISSDATITPMQEEADQNRQKLTLLPSYVKPGGWYEIFVSDDSAKRRLKLSVIIMEDACLVFVDRLGVKVLDKDAEVFAEELEQGKSAFLADDSIFDNALSRVIGHLVTKH